MNDRSFVKHAAVYGLASLLVQAGGFILLPLYTHCLSPADYGVLEILGRLAETVGACLLFGGLRQALLTFYQQGRDEAERRRVVASILSLFGVTGLLGGGLALALAGPLSDWLNGFMHSGSSGINRGLLRLAVLAILLEPLSQIPLTLMQARVESLRFVSITLMQFVVRLGLCVLFVKCLDGGVAGALGATVLMGSIFGLVLCTREVLRGPAWPSRYHLRGLFRFALPLMPGGLCFLLLHHGDRFFLFRYCSAEDVGTYALGYKLALAAGTFSLAPLYMVWGAHMYTVARREDASLVFGAAFTRILAVYLLVALALGLFQDEVVRLVGGTDYASAAAVVAPVLLGYFFQSAASLMDAGLYVRRRTGLKLGITLATTVVMLLLYGVLIPSHGSMGAAWATLLGFAFLAGCTWTVTQRVFPVRYEWTRLIAMLTLAAGLWLLSRLLPAEPWSWPIKGALWLAGPAAAWGMGLLSSQEKEQLRGLSEAARRRAIECWSWSRTFRAPAQMAARERAASGTKRST